MDKPVYLTAEGKVELEERLNYLKSVRRPEVADRIQQAKLDGDISESGEYEDAKNEQAWVEGEIRDLEYKLQNAQIYQSARSDTGGPGFQSRGARRRRRRRANLDYRGLGRGQLPPDAHLQRVARWDRRSWAIKRAKGEGERPGGVQTYTIKRVE